MKRQLIILLAILAVCAVAARLRPAPVPVRVPADQVGLGEVRAGDTFDAVTARYGRLDSTTRVPTLADEWKVCHYGPFDQLLFAQQPQENDLWQVAHIVGGPVTLGNTTVVHQGDSQDSVLERLGPPDARAGQEWDWALTPRRPLEVLGRDAQPRLIIVWKEDRVERTEIVCVARKK